jgi:hypothetical protein
MNRTLAAPTVLPPGPPRKGILVFVLRSTLGDCTNGGLSARHDKFVLIDNPEQRHGADVFNVTPDSPALYLAKWYGRIIAVPEDLYSLTRVRNPQFRSDRPDTNIDHLWSWMFGGNYVETSDSRLRTINEYPIPVYDRKE